MVTDFGEPTLGMEAPWGKASMVFYYRSAHMKALGTAPPQTINELLRFSQKAPGRFTYPVPSDYLGISFIKYAAIALNGDKQSLFYQPVTESSLQAVLPEDRRPQRAPSLRKTHQKERYAHQRRN